MTEHNADGAGEVSAEPGVEGRGAAADEYGGLGRVLVVIPTYNEADNIELIVGRVRAAVPVVDVLVVDDASPDGTGKLADALAAGDASVHVLHRSGKNGLGAAYLAGFDWAASREYDVVCEMDADGSHAPEQLPRLLDGLESADLVCGSRYVPGGSVRNWSPHRLLLSRGGNLYTRVALGMPLKDATGGYRAYRMPVLTKITTGWTPQQGYCFQIDLARRALAAGFQVVEVPITFADRERGESKMNGSFVREALWRVAVWGARDRARRVSRRFGRTD